MCGFLVSRYRHSMPPSKMLEIYWKNMSRAFDPTVYLIRWTTTTTNNRQWFLVPVCDVSAHFSHQGLRIMRINCFGKWSNHKQTLSECKFPNSIKGIAHKRSDEDYKAATWKKYLSFSRAAIISASYKKLWALREDIEVCLKWQSTLSCSYPHLYFLLLISTKHSNDLVLKDQNDHLLQMMRLHHRNISSAHEEERWCILIWWNTCRLNC